ncbi:hypothetical protein D9M68_268530 [compost metagenome]
MPRITRTPSPTRQRGMATILIVLLAGLALTATALGVMHAVRGAQQKQVAVHASTHAQAGAWAGTEIFRQYLEQLDETELGQLQEGDDIVMTVGERELHASIATSPEEIDAGRYRVTANIRNQDDAARATSTIQAVYAVAPGGGQSNPSNPWDNVINISGDLDMRGSVDVKGGDNANFNVDGRIDLGGSVTGIKTMRATGDIELGGAVQVYELFTNGNITLHGSSAATKASALGNINVQSAGSQGKFYANGNVRFGNGGGSVGTVDALGNVYCVDTSWSRFVSIRAGKSVFDCPLAPDRIAENRLDEMQPLQPFVPPKPRVDAYELKDLANYVFEYRNGQVQVSVRNVNGIADGAYRLGKIRQNYNDRWGYLCSALDGNGYCREECSTVNNGSCAGVGVDRLRKITQGTWDGAQSIAYDNGTWRLSGDGGDNAPAVVAPGALWFDGNLDLDSGKYRNTILATGNIATRGSHRTWSVNFAGYAETCNSAFYSGLYPSNFCNIGTQKLKSNALGNIGLLAGGYVGSAFNGGNIALGASTQVYGSVIAGNALETNGQSLIKGYVTVAKQGNATGTDWRGNTTIDLENLPESFDPGGIPGMGGEDPCQGDCGQEGEQTSQATLLWSRYL